MRFVATAVFVGAFVLLSASSASTASAQSGWWEFIPVNQIDVRSQDTRSGPAVIYRERGDRGPRSEAPRRNDRYDPYDRYDRNQQRGNRGRGNGPAFCRSGEGHPVFGRQWCRDKGFGLGGDRRYDQRRDRDRRYDSRNRIPDIIFGGRSSRGTLDQRRMEGILGRSTVNMLASVRDSARLSGNLNARWVPTRDGRSHVMQVRSGNTPLAELVDMTGDRRVNYVVLFD
jgi:hypothetical protein